MRLTAGGLAVLAVATSVAWAAHEVAGTGSRAYAQLPGVSQVAVDAYTAAANGAPASCGIRWSLVAGIGATETGHGTFGGSVVGADGAVTPPIRGPQLDGIEFALIRDTDDGVLDGDTVYDRAVGPMQFIPATWRHYARPGDDPQNIRDAARATVALLCSVAAAEGKPLTDAAVEEAAIRAYNNSDEYVEVVRGFAGDFGQVATEIHGEGVTAEAVASKLGNEGRRRWERLGEMITRAPGDKLDQAFDLVDPTAGLLWTTLDRDGVTAEIGLSSDASAGGMVTVRGITVAASIADDVTRLVDAAADDDVTLTGSGYRTADEQMALRVQHCPDPVNSDPGDCSPPTARVGTSNHERGLAIDFSLGSGSPEFRWLTANAARFGLYNLPSEPWHWSVDGR